MCIFILNSGISRCCSGLQAPLLQANLMVGAWIPWWGLDTIYQALVLKLSWALSTGGRALNVSRPWQQRWICVPGVSSGCTVATTLCMQTECSVQCKPHQPSHLSHQAIEEGFKFCCFCTLGKSCALQSWGHRGRRRSAGGTGMKGCLHTVELTKPLLFLSVK